MELTVLEGFDPHGDVDAGVARRAARAWLAGGIVGLPTETVYGLAADAQDPDAVARIYRAKGRPADHPLIVHVAGPEALSGWSAGPDAAAARLAEAFWPGPLTVVVRRGERAGDFVTGGQDTVALRCPAHPVARACIRALAELRGDAARGVAAPSANRFGRVSPTRAQDVVAEVGDRLDPVRDLIVDGGPCAVGVESTIVDCTADPPRVIRLGAISQAQVDSALAAASPTSAAPAAPPTSAAPAAPPTVAAPAAPPTSAAAAAPPTVAAPTLLDHDPFRLSAQERGEPAWITEDGADGGEVRAPGTLDSHYAPNARVVLVDPRPRDAQEVGSAVPEGVDEAWLRAAVPVRGGPLDGEQQSRPGLIADRAVETPVGWVRLLAADDSEGYARDLYAALRAADALGLAQVVAVLPDPEGGPLATAVRDRLTRAAHRD